MLNLIQNSPYKMLLFFSLVVFCIAYLGINMKKPKTVYFAIVFYIPLSFCSLSGCLALYLIMLLYIWSLQFKDTTNTKGIELDKYLILLVTFFSSLSLLLGRWQKFITTDPSGSMRISQDYMVFIIMISCFGLYQMTKKFITTFDDLKKLLKVMVVSGSVATIAGYLQLFSTKNTFIFKYIVLGERAKWGERIAATMQGYEFLAEYTAILIIISIVLLLISNKNRSKIFYFLLTLNFLIILTLTQVRGIFVAIAVSLIYLILLLFITGKVKASSKMLMSSLMVFIVLVGAIFLIDHFRSENKFIDRLTKMSINISEGDFSTRTEVWNYGVENIRQMSLIEKTIGAGYKYFDKTQKTNFYRGWPHSLYMAYVMRDGFLGVSLFLLFMLWLYIQSLKAIGYSKMLENKKIFVVGIALHMALVIFLVDEIKIEFIRHDRSQNLIWLFFSIIAVYPNILKSKIVKLKS